MITKIQSIKKEIISGAIVSIVLFFGQSIGLFLWKTLLRFSLDTYSGFIDYVYFNAALDQRNWIDFLSFSLLLYIIFYYTTKKTLNTNSSINKFKFKKENEESRKKDIIKIKLFLEKHIIKFKYLLIILNFVIYFFFMVILFITFIDLQLNTSFNQQLTVIAPYIDDQKEELFKSKWSLMKNRKDYEVIIQDFEKTALKNNIKLPNLLVK